MANITLKNIHKIYPGDVTAVKDFNLEIQDKEFIILFGPSGCGKSTTGRTIIGLYEPTAGTVEFEGQALTGEGNEEKIQMIFQDPYACLNPRMTVGDIIGEPLDIHHVYPSKEERMQRVYELLSLVGLNPEQANRFPHEFSGGQRQRIGIARALAIQPKLIICDEPISALDVSIQAQVVNLLSKLQKDLGLTYLFIAHDLAMVRYISQRVAVMYLGKIVEIADTEDLYEKPFHPYTKALLSAIPEPDPDSAQERIHLAGELPSPIDPPKGCHFCTRCQYAEDICYEIEPILKHYGNRQAACHFVNEDGLHKAKQNEK